MVKVLAEPGIPVIPHHEMVYVKDPHYAFVCMLYMNPQGGTLLLYGKYPTESRSWYLAPLDIL